MCFCYNASAEMFHECNDVYAIDQIEIMVNYVPDHEIRSNLFRFKSSFN